MAARMSPTTPIMIMDLRFSSQNLFLRAPARFSNWALPSCKASARSSSEESLASRSRLKEKEGSIKAIIRK